MGKATTHGIQHEISSMMESQRIDLSMMAGRPISSVVTKRRRRQTPNIISGEQTAINVREEASPAVTGSSGYTGLRVRASSPLAPADKANDKFLVEDLLEKRVHNVKA
jgi:hypothetical protein